MFRKRGNGTSKSHKSPGETGDFLAPRDIITERRQSVRGQAETVDFRGIFSV